MKPQEYLEVVELNPADIKGSKNLIIGTGRRIDRFYALPDFLMESGAKDCVYLEPEIQYIELFKNSGYKIIQGDIRWVPLFKTIDIAWWIHGPEHLYLGEIFPVLANLKNSVQTAVIAACPWGNFFDDWDKFLKSLSPWETHRTKDIDIQDFLSLGVSDLGYRFQTRGVKDTYSGEIILSWENNHKHGKTWKEQ